MQAVEYYAEVLPNGHISLPQNTMKELWLSKGNKIKVILLNDQSSELKKENEEVSKFCWGFWGYGSGRGKFCLLWNSNCDWN